MQTQTQVKSPINQRPVNKFQRFSIKNVRHRGNKPSTSDATKMKQHTVRIKSSLSEIVKERSAKQSKITDPVLEASCYNARPF